MTKIYLVTDGDYSDYTVEAVFLDKDEAEKFRDYHNYDHLEEFELGAKKIDTELRGWAAYGKHTKDEPFTGFDRIVRNGTDYIKSNKNSFVKCRSSAYSNYVNVSTFMLARDEAHATKIASERARAFIAKSTSAYECQYDSNIKSYVVTQYAYGIPDFEVQTKFQVTPEDVNLYV